MSSNKFQLPVSGFKDGLNTQASVLSIRPSEMASGSKNVDLLHNSSVRRRKAADFVGVSDTGNYLHDVRSGTIAAEIAKESPSGVYLQLTAPNGDIIERTIIDVDNEFRVFTPTRAGMRNFDDPAQTLTRSLSYSKQVYHTMTYAASGNKLYFAGKYTQPGYIKVASDNVSLEIVYYDVIIRDPNAVAENTVRKVGDAWYECKENHTSATATNKPGSGTDWERYWFQKDGKAAASITAWADATAYTSNLVKQYDSSVAPTSSDLYPTTVAFFGGRVWLAGDPRNPNDAYFSQVVGKDADISLFLQMADTFNEDDPDLVADDGGVISIQGSGLISQLIAVSNALFLGTNTGIWQCSGPNGIFRATDFSIVQVLDDGVEGSHNMVLLNRELIVWGEDSVWRSEINTSLSSTETGKAKFTNISENKIQNYYDGISKSDKAAAVAMYNPSERRVYYFHNESRTSFDEAYDKYTQPGYFTRCMVLDAQFDSKTNLPADDPDRTRTVEGSYYLYEFADTGKEEQPYIAFPFLAAYSQNTQNVVSGGSTVVVGGSQVVTAGNSGNNSSTMFVAMHRRSHGATVTIKGSIGTLNTAVLRDWNSDSTYAVSYDSVIITGAQTLGNVYSEKTIPYIFLVFKKVESGVLDADGIDLTPGGCLMATSWNWSTNVAHPKYATPVSVYVPTRWTYSTAGSGTDDESHAYVKHRVRGRGNAVQITFTNDGDKDFHIVGWSQQLFGTLR